MFDCIFGVNFAFWFSLSLPKYHSYRRCSPYALHGMFLALKVCRYEIYILVRLIAFYVIVDCVYVCMCVCVWFGTAVCTSSAVCVCVYTIFFFLFIFYLNLFYSVRKRQTCRKYTQTQTDSVNAFISFTLHSIRYTTISFMHTIYFHFVRTHAGLIAVRMLLSQTLMFILKLFFCFISFSSLRYY